MSSDLPILTKLRCKLQRGCYTQATCLETLRKVEGRSTFLATCNATFLALQVARKIASCNMALSKFKHKQVECMARKMLLMFSNISVHSRDIQVFKNMQISQVIMAYTQPNFRQMWWKKISQPIWIKNVWFFAVRFYKRNSFWQHTKFQGFLPTLGVPFWYSLIVPYMHDAASI